MDEANAKTHHVRPITEFPHPRCYKRNEGRVSSESQHSTSAKQSGHERGDARRRPSCMDSILLLFVVAILFVLWLVLVTFSTCNFQMKRHVHHHGFHLGGRG